jgi:hypothetical protein
LPHRHAFECVHFLRLGAGLASPFPVPQLPHPLSRPPCNGGAIREEHRMR